MAINLANPTYVGKGGVNYFPGGDAINSGHGIRVFEAHSGVDCLIENVRFQVVNVQATNDITVSLYGSANGTYTAIASNVALRYNSSEYGGAISVIDESTSIWITNQVAGCFDSLYAKVNDAGLGKVQVIIDYEIFANSSANGLAQTPDYADSVDQTDDGLYLIENTTSAGKFEIFDNDNKAAVQSWTSSGTAASYITPSSGSITLIDGYGSVTFNTSSTSGNTYTGTLTNSATGGTTSFTVGPAQEHFAMPGPVYFTVAQALTNASSSSDHRTGPTSAEAIAWMTGTSSGSPGYSWASDSANFSVPVQGYQIMRIPKTATYRIRAKGAHSGYTDSYTGQVTRPATIVQADFALTKGNYLVIAVGQGVPVYSGDHCNGGAGASWVAHNTAAQISGSECLLVAGGGPAATSDGSTKLDPPTSLSRSVSISSATGNETDGRNVTSYSGNIATSGSARSGSWLSSYTDTYGYLNGGFLTGNLVGGGRDNSTAGWGAFGGGSTGDDEAGAGSGGFSGSYGTDNTSVNGIGTSFVSTNFSAANSSCSLSTITTVYQATDYKSELQFQGVVSVEQL